MTMIQDCRDSNAQTHQDIRASLEDNEAASAAAIQDLSRLVKVCAGIDVGVRDFQCVLDSQHTRIDQRFRRLEGLQRQCLAVIPTTARGITDYVDRVIATARPLFQAFGEFSIDALNMLRRILQTNLEIYALLLRIQAQISRALSPSTEDCIHFQDALGRVQELPYNWFRHWEIFESMLRCVFKNLPGERHVLRNRYHLLSPGQENRLIYQSSWDRRVFPGADVKMSITSELVQPQLTCPRTGCNTQNTQGYNENAPEGHEISAIWSVALLRHVSLADKIQFGLRPSVLCSDS